MLEVKDTPYPVLSGERALQVLTLIRAQDETG